MGYAILHQSGGGVSSEDVTAAKAQVLSGYSTVTSDSDDEVVEGTMVNHGAVNQSLSINGSYTIPKGYHNGQGKVTQSVTTKAAQTYYPSTSEQSIAPGRYLSGAQTIAAVGQENLSAGNIKNGTTVKITNGNGNIYSITGNYHGTKTSMYACAASGSGMGANHPDLDEKTFTMPRDGVVYYGGMSAAYAAAGRATCEIYKNDTLIDSRPIVSDYYIRPQMSSSFTASKGDVIKIRCNTTSGNASIAYIHAVYIY